MNIRMLHHLDVRERDLARSVREWIVMGAGAFTL